MTPEERDRFMGRLIAAWGTGKPLPDSTQIVWHEHLNGLDFDRSMKALGVLEVESRHRPALSDFYESYKVQPGKGGRAVEAPVCGICDNGFVEVAYNTVKPCPSGCKPMTSTQRQAHTDRVEREYDRHRERDKVGANIRPLDFTEPGSRAEPEMDF